LLAHGRVGGLASLLEDEDGGAATRADETRMRAFRARRRRGHVPRAPEPRPRTRTHRTSQRRGRGQTGGARWGWRRMKCMVDLVLESRKKRRHEYIGLVPLVPGCAMNRD
jgi:hypothetical protein